MQHGDHMTGYIRLVNFSQKAAPEMRHAIANLQVERRFSLLPVCLPMVFFSLSAGMRANAPSGQEHHIVAFAVGDFTVITAIWFQLGYTNLLSQLWMLQVFACLQERGCDSFILDLRNNPGGLVRAGLDIARLWLPGEAAILTVEGRDVAGSTAVLQVRLCLCIADCTLVQAATSVPQQCTCFGKHSGLARNCIVMMSIDALCVTANQICRTQTTRDCLQDSCPLQPSSCCMCCVQSNNAVPCTQLLVVCRGWCWRQALL